MKPDDVYMEPFSNIMKFIDLWSEQGRYYDRYREVEKTFSEIEKQ